MLPLHCISFTILNAKRAIYSILRYYLLKNLIFFPMRFPPSRSVHTGIDPMFFVVNHSFDFSIANDSALMGFRSFLRCGVYETHLRKRIKALLINLQQLLAAFVYIHLVNSSRPLKCLSHRWKIFQDKIDRYSCYTISRVVTFRHSNYPNFRLRCIKNMLVYVAPDLQVQWCHKNGPYTYMRMRHVIFVSKTLFN